MAGTNVNIVRRIRSMLGPDAVVDSDPIPRVAPRTEDALVLVLQAANAEGWRVRIEGSGSWIPRDGPADLAVATSGLARITRLDPADLVATVEAGVVWTQLRQALAEHGVWVALDPPGDDRTVGGVVASGTAGPLRSGFGAVREHVLGASVVTGEGHLLRAGGRVVKNVAGFDLTKLACGSFGGFGIVTSVHLRLRAVPRADVTLRAEGERDGLLHRALAIIEAGVTPAALELLSPKAAGRGDWTLAVRLMGSAPAVETDRDAAMGAGALGLTPLASEEAADFWRRAGARATQAPVTLRAGTLPGALDDALDLLSHHLDDDWVMASVGAGALRWSGAAPLDRLRLFRHAAAQHEMPITLERAPWSLRGQLGHFGAYREGVGPLVSALRASFDPAGVLAVPLSAP